jgi:hypothetical protein
MSAYLNGQISVKDSQLWQEYVAGVSESLATCRTNNELAANSSLWPIFQLLFDQ